ncbi:hypothetical protein GCM10023329_46900 [Streptomyces sanyensis]|uniref:Transposase n=1 Tax=Streptomyces sanyensis TaxID=568869 RepID=A0ABP9B4Q9_9ACTN
MWSRWRNAWVIMTSALPRTPVRELPWGAEERQRNMVYTRQKANGTTDGPTSCRVAR